MWRHTWRKKWVNCAVLKGNRAGLRTVLSSRISHRELLSSSRCQALYSALQRPPTTCPSTSHVCKTRVCQSSFRLLMMGGVSPETCWALYKYGIIKILMHCCILLDFFFLYELYYDARIREHQVHKVELQVKSKAGSYSVPGMMCLRKQNLRHWSCILS